ncbi:MAG: hypothetical protein AAGB02_07285 [Pseudomonadota bacterium]
MDLSSQPQAWESLALSQDIPKAVSQMLASHGPFPAFSMDRNWDLIEYNDAAQLLFVFGGVDGAGNLLDAIIASADSPDYVNWPEAAAFILQRLARDIEKSGGNHTLERYFSQIQEHPRYQPAHADKKAGDQQTNDRISVFRLNSQKLMLYSAMAVFETIGGDDLSDIRVELMFPVDPETRAFFARLNSAVH